MNPFPRCAEPDLDPLPSLTDRYRRSGAFHRDPLDSRLTPSAVASMRGTIQSVVSGLQTDDRPFRAMFGKTSTAATDLKARLVYIGTKAMDDTTISDGRLAAIMTGLAYHEVAHINHDREYHAFVVKSLSGHDLAALTSDVHNIGQDIRIEARIKRDRPGYAETLAVTLWYVTTTGGVGRKAGLTGLSTMAARNQFFAAVRAPWQITDWSLAITAMQWGEDWAGRMAATDKRSEIVDLIREALDMIQSWTLGPKGPKPPIIDEPPIDEPPPGPDDDIDPPPPVDDDDPPEDPPTGPKGPDDDDTDPPPVDDDDPDGPDGPDGPDDEDPPPDDEDPEDPPKPGKGTTDGGDDTEGGDDEPTPDIGDVSNKWTDDPEIDVNIDHVSPDNAAGEEGSERTFDLEDLEFPACAADALKGANDNTYGAVAARIEKSREEGNTRIIRTPGWPDRTVKRAWDMPNK